MNMFLKKNNKNIIFLIVSGFLGFLIYPTVLFGWKLPDLGILAWVYLIPLYWVLNQYKGSLYFWISTLVGLITYCGSLYWLGPAMTNYGELSVFESSIILLLVVVILSFFFATGLTLAQWIFNKTNIPLFIVRPVLLVGFEYLRYYVPVNGFPWPLVGYSQGHYLSYFQWIDITGIFGLCFYIYLVNDLFFEIILSYQNQRRDKLVNRLVLLFIMAVVSIVISTKQYSKVDDWVSLEKPFQVALIQGNIHQDLKWDPMQARENLALYIELTDKAAINEIDLAVWPETAYPHTVDLSDLYGKRLIERGSLPSYVLTGAVTILPSQWEEEPTVYNSAMLLGQDSVVQEIYHKRHLVPFGEYVPLKEWLQFAKRLTVAVGDFSPGDQPTVIALQKLKIGILICYEDIFSNLSTELVENGANILFNLTNDAWYGNTSAAYQHLVFSQVRALENRRYLLRATNTGITSVIDFSGRIIAQLKPFTEDILIKGVQLSNHRTIHSTIGNFIALLALITSLVFIGLALWGRRFE